MAKTAQIYTTTEKMNDCGYRRGRQPQRKPRVTVTYRFVKYIPKQFKEEYEALGWIVRDALAGTHHGDWSYIGEFFSDRDEEPPMPVLRGDAEEHKAMPVGPKC